MKKTILSLMALPLLLACSSEEQPTAGQAGRVPLQVNFGGITRGAIETLPVECTYGVYVTQNSYAGSNNVEDGINRRVSYVEGVSTMDRMVYIPENGSVYVWAYYPYNEALDKGAMTAMPLETKSQTDYLVSAAHYASESSANVSLTMRHALARIHVTLRKAEDNTKEYYYKVMTLRNAYQTASYNFDGEYTVDGQTADITTYMTGGDSSLQDGAVVEFDFLVMPSVYTNGMSVSLYNDTDLTANLPARTYEAGQQYDITITINHLGQLEVGQWTIVPWNTQVQNGLEVWKDSKTGEGEEEPQPTTPAENIHEGHEYVDLGLPSGTLWAKCNIGAETPLDRGEKYAWGETEPKTGFSWNNYKWCEGTYSSMTKYCSNDYYGVIDNKTVLELADDAAYAQWGGKWRMPTSADLNELAANTTVELTTVDGVIVYKVTGTNGNFIYFPADTLYQNYMTICHTTDMDDEDNYALNVRVLYFTTKDGVKLRTDAAASRSTGTPIRPVIHVLKVAENIVLN